MPNLVSNSVTTTVELESGQTFVLGGITTHHVTGTADKIPVIGDLPYLGVFFSNKQFTETDEEVIILVTPHLVDAQDCGQVSKILPGQETRRPDDYELFLEGILEAPRGQREVFQDGHYVPAFKSGPSAGQFPCGVNGSCGSCGNGACGSTGCTSCNGGGNAVASNATELAPPVGAMTAPTATLPTAAVQTEEPKTLPTAATTQATAVDINVTPLPDNSDKGPQNMPVGAPAPGDHP